MTGTTSTCWFILPKKPQGLGLRPADRNSIQVYHVGRWTQPNYLSHYYLLLPRVCWQEAGISNQSQKPNPGTLDMRDRHHGSRPYAHPYKFFEEPL